MNELLNPNAVALGDIYKNEFDGMTNEPVNLSSLIEVQKDLPSLLLKEMTDGEKEFLVSFKQAKPKWQLIDVPHLKDLPGVKWKLLNIRKMDQQKHREELKKSEYVLAG